MKVGIIGYGFVGRALHNGLSSSADVFLVDPKLDTNIDDLVHFSPDIIFICVPTPMKDCGNQDLSILDSVIEKLIEAQIDCITVLKSTVLPDVISKIKGSLSNIAYNPEFLREKHAYTDFINSKLIVLGGKPEVVREIKIFYTKYTKCICKEYVETDLESASLLKYTINSFLATKVSFFNEINQIFKKSNAEDSWENFIKYLAIDNRIGNSHMSVPGHDGKYGFGGACLPKDSAAFIGFAKRIGVNLSVLSEAVNVNDKIRKNYQNDPRESVQNINFDKKETINND